MPITATGTSVKGRQILGIAQSNDTLLRVYVTDAANPPSAPQAKYYGYISVEYPQPSLPMLFQSGGDGMWTLGKFLNLPFVGLADRRIVMYWRIAGIPWQIQTFA